MCTTTQAIDSTSYFKLLSSDQRVDAANVTMPAAPNCILSITLMTVKFTKDVLNHLHVSPEAFHSSYFFCRCILAIEE